VPVADLRLGAQRYRAEPAAPTARVDVSASASGRLFRLRLETLVAGPCWRCLGEARAPVVVDAREFAATGRPADAPFDEDLDSAYLAGHVLDVAAWVRDAVVEELPSPILCREDCPGLCATCGASLADGPCGCPAPAPDARWAPLADLAERLRRQ
jgi:uncharacterized protein